MRARRLLGLGLVSVQMFGFVQAGDEPAPIPTQMKESVEVRLVIMDVVALDDKERTVPDLTKDDFRLFVDRKETPIDTLDVQCDGGSDDPKSKKFAGWTMPADLSSGTRRIVLAFDYIHLTTVPCPDAVSDQPCLYHTQALRDYQSMLTKNGDVHDEELMVAALTGGLRIEQPFTPDHAAVVATLRRMENDITLWNGTFDPITEMSLFSGLDALITILHAVPGPKAIVFLTAGNGPSEFYQLYFERLAAAASDARVTIYPVDCRGIFAARTGLPGGPPGLWRMASSTGGRLIQNTNDPTIGYARARRDLGCRYTIGFYDRKAQEDKPHELHVDSLRPGVHLLAADRYSFPSNKARLENSVQAAFLVPQMFEGGGMRAQVFPLQPKDTSIWDALVDIDFPVPKAAKPADPSTRDFGVVLQRGTEAVHTFHRSITLSSARLDAGTGERRITFLESTTMPPGRYVVTAVLSDPANDKPFSYRAELTVPEIPRRKVFLTGPILGRRSGDDVVVYGKTNEAGAPDDHVGNRTSFRPLIIGEANREQPLAALTHACVVKPRRDDGPWVAKRVLYAEDGSVAGELPDVTFVREGKGAVQCRRLFDELPVAGMKLGRYTFRATLSEAGSELSPIESSQFPFALIAMPQTPP